MDPETARSISLKKVFLRVGMLDKPSYLLLVGPNA